MTDKYTEPKPVWVTTEEGGDYIPWKEWTLDWPISGRRWGMIGGKHGFRIHSVGFDNGRVFDNYGGWRNWNPDSVSHELRVRMGLEKPDSISELVDKLSATSKRAQEQLADLADANAEVRKCLAEARRVIGR